MAFSTQKNFMKIDSLRRRGVPLEPKDSYSAGIKHYFSCYDARAWSFDSGQRNLYLSDVIGCCQDNWSRPCTPVCYCTDRGECDMGERNRYDKSERKHSSRDTNELSKISNTVKNESGQGTKRRSEQVEMIQDGDNSSTYVDQNGEVEKRDPWRENDNQSKISKRDSQLDNKLKGAENNSRNIEKEIQKADPHEIHGNHSKNVKEAIRQSENEKVDNELVDDADPSSSDHAQNIEIFDVNEQELEGPSNERDADNNESSLSDNIIRDSTLEFIFNTEMAKDRRPWEISYDFPRPVSQRPPIGYFAGEGDCEERRQNVRELIRIKGEETVAELMQVLHNYEKKFEYFKRVCQERKAQLESGDKIQLQRNSLTQKNGRNVNNIRPQAKRPSTTAGDNGPTLVNSLNRRKHSPPSKLTTISYVHPQFKPRSVTNLTSHNLRSNASENSLPPSSTPSDRRHRHEDLFFHKPNSVFHFNNTKQAIDAVEGNMELFTNNINAYSKELVGAVKKLTKVIQEFAEFKETIEKVVKVDTNNHNIIRPANVAGPSGVRNPLRRSQRRQASTSSLEMKGKHFPGGKLERKSAGADGSSKNSNCHASERYELLERCRNALAEIHKHFTKQKHEIRDVNACKGQWAHILKTHREAFIKLHQHNCCIHRKSEQIREYIADIESSLNEVKVTGFTKYRPKAGCSTQTAPSSQSLLCYDLGVDLHIENLTFDDFPSNDKMKKILEAKMTKMQTEIDLISEQITYKTMRCNSQLETESQVLKDKEDTEKAVLKMCRKIRALEANALKIKTAIVGKDKIVYNPFEQFCSKRALKRIKTLQMDLQKIQTTAEFKANLLQAAREAKDRRMRQNQNLKQDIDVAKKTIEELENYIKKFQSIVCGEIYNEDEEIVKPKKSSTSSSSSGGRPSAKIVKPSSGTPASHTTASGTPTASSEYLVDEKSYGPVDNPEQASFTETSNSDLNERSSQEKSMSNKLTPTSEIEIEIPPSVNSPIEEVPSLVVIKPPIDFQSSESSGEKRSSEESEKLSVDHDATSLIVSKESPFFPSEGHNYSSTSIPKEIVHELQKEDSKPKIYRSDHEERKSSKSFNSANKSNKGNDFDDRKSSSVTRSTPHERTSKTSSAKSIGSSPQVAVDQHTPEKSRSIKSQKSSISSQKSVLKPSASHLKESQLTKSAGSSAKSAGSSRQVALDQHTSEKSKSIKSLKSSIGSQKSVIKPSISHLKESESTKSTGASGKSAGSSRQVALDQHTLEKSRSIKSEKSSIGSQKSVLKSSTSHQKESPKTSSSNKQSQKSFDQRISDVMSEKNETQGTNILNNAILSILSHSSLETASTILRKSSDLKKELSERKSKQNLVDNEAIKEFKSLNGKLTSSQRTEKEHEKNRGTPEFSPQLSKIPSKTNIDDKSSQSKIFKPVLSSEIKNEISNKSILSDEKSKLVRISSQMGQINNQANTTASLNKLEIERHSSTNVKQPVENIIKEEQFQHSNLSIEKEKVETDTENLKTSIADATDHAVLQSIESSKSAFREIKTTNEKEKEKSAVNSEETEAFIVRAKDEESVKSNTKPQTSRHDVIEMITEDKSLNGKLEIPLSGDTKPETLQEHIMPQLNIEVSGKEMDFTAPQLPTSTEIGQNQTQEACIECFNYVEELKLELSALKEKSKQLSDSEAFYQKQIKKLEAELQSAKQLYQLQSNIERTITEKDCAVWIQKYKLTEDDVNKLQLLFTHQTETLAIEHAKNLEYQEKASSLQESLIACQQELEKLHEIHSKCKPQMADTTPDFSEWENKVQTLQAEIKKLREDLRTKDEQFKELQHSQVRLRNDPDADEYKSKWLSSEAELQVCKKQLETLYSGGNDQIVKELNEKLAIYEQENAQLRDKVMQADNDIAKIGQRLSTAIYNLNLEKQTSSELRRKIQEYHTKVNASENVKDRSPIQASKHEYDTTGSTLSTNSVNAILQKQNSTLQYLCHLQTSVKDLLLELRSVMNKDHSVNESGSNIKCLNNSDEIHSKINKICSCLKRLGMQNKYESEECTCSKKSRLEKICAKILQRGINCLKWEDLSYLHEIVYKTGCAMRGLSVCKKSEECQCCGDAARIAVHGDGGTPVRKITKIKQEIAGVRDLILLLKNEYQET